MTGNADQLAQGRPSTEPLYSKGTREHFPIPSKYQKVKYTDFISSHVKNCDDMLISQSLHKKRFSGIFGPHKKYKKSGGFWGGGFEHSWGKKRTYDDLVEYVKQEWKSNKHIFSLTADDESGSFYVYLVKGYGDVQSIVKGKDLSLVEKNWDNGKMITSCTSKGSTYYIVMTDNVNGYHGKGQTYISTSSWSDIENEIGKHYKDGKIITSICYNQGLQEYLVVMTTSSAGQSYKWTNNPTSNPTKTWMDKMYKVKDYHPTIIFEDPNDDQTLIVMTSDNDRTCYTTRYNYELV